ncbi:Rho GTPase-activating protein gacY [Smittium culicis]|uniref:Rho GTPase-activating protein gacY n=1 Tax=Smittium culicis TaxID=133412 RepID=A0A1R1YPY3_9FUNG|nr:Rho GTPase-activating protein gacY [Smittium culicis]
MTNSEKKHILDQARARGFNLDLPDGDFGANVDKNLLYFAGLDNETLPIIVLSDHCLPDPKIVDYDSLLQTIIKKSSSIVDNEYVIVYFAGNGPHKPSWQWIISAYYSLDRKYKKNLKKLYLVHPSTWTKLLLNTFASIISNKFYSKLVYVESIEHLKALVPIDRIQITQPTIDKDSENTAKHYSVPISAAISIAHQIPSDKRLFGAQINQVVITNPASDIYTLPIPLVNWLLHLHKTGTYTQNVFQHLPETTNVTESKLKTQIEYSKNRNSSEFLKIYDDVNTSAFLLKLFFYELQDPIFNSELVELFTQLPLPDSLAELSDITVSLQIERKRINFIKSKVLPLLSPQQRQLLTHLFCLLSSIAHNSEQNHMTSFNLAKNWAPILIGKYLDEPVCYLETVSVSPSLPSTGSVVQLLIQYFYVIFSSEINTILKVNNVHSEALFNNMVHALESQLNIYRE